VKKFLLIICLFVLSNIILPQTIVSTYDCSLEGVEINYFTKVEAPNIAEYSNMLLKVQTITIDINYEGNWPGEAKSAFDYAIKIWKYLINSSMPIKIKAKWTPLGESSGALAQTTTTSYKKNFQNAPLPDVNYPISLAEALSGSELNGSQDDEIEIEVNSDFADKWYYGIDGNTPEEKYDLVSVILHEFAHGLGISHSMNVSNNLGSWGQRYKNEDDRGYKQVFESFSQVTPNSSTIYKLTNTNTYPNPSDGLAGAIQSNNVYFDGPISKQINLNNLPKLYAPSPFDGGSSIAHLDEETFPAGNSNSLLSPQLGMAESIHSPGELGLALLQDLGWNVNRLITVLSPGPGMAYLPGQSETISWTDNIGGAIAIELLKKNIYGEYEFYSTIASHPSPKGEINTYNWIVPVAEGVFKIRMIDNTFSNEGFGLSYSFVISSQAQVATPIIYPPGDNYFSAQTITITCSTPGATIYYTDDNSEPSSENGTNGTEYTQPFIISTDKIIKAKAIKSGFPDSHTRTEIYLFGEQILPPSISPQSGTYLELTPITVSWPTDIECYYNYTENGSEPQDPSVSGYQLSANPRTFTFLANYTIKMKFRTRKNGTWGPLRYVQYAFLPAFRVAQVDDEIVGDNSFGRWNKWENNQWKDYPDIRFERPDQSIDWFLQAKQNYKDETTRKYNVWRKNSTQNFYVNHTQIQVDQNTSSVLAHFKETYDATVKNNLEGSLSVNSGNFYFKDPWYIDDDSDSKGDRNRGSNPLPVLMDFDTEPNITTDSDHKGVFLNQGYPNWTPPYYSVQAISPQDINLGGSIGTRRFWFQKWDGNNVQYEDDDALETGVVFTDEDAEAQAIFKGHLLSNETSGLSSNSQRKLVRDNSGYYHTAYTSLDHVWYTHSSTTDFGGSWIQDQAMFWELECKNPSIDVTGTTVALVTELDDGSGVYYVYLWESNTGQYTEIAEIDENYFGKAKPVVARTPKQIFIIYKRSASSPLKYRRMYYWNNQWNYYDAILPHSTSSSKNPTIYGNEQNDDVYIAWQEGDTKIKYLCLEWRNQTMTEGYYSEPSSGDGYTKNFSPSIININYIARIVWVGRRVSGGGGGPSKINGSQETEALMDVNQVIFKSPTSSRFWIFGADVNSPNINKVDNNTGYVFGWSQSYAGGLVNKFADQTLSTIKTIPNVSGRDIQISNGPGKSSMYSIVLNTDQSPYDLEKSQSFGSIQKTNSGLVISAGREGVVYKGEGQFYFTLGDITVNDEHINFVEIPDTLAIDSRGVLNSCLVTEPFSLNDNSDFTYGVQYGITDSTAAASTLDDDDFISFKIELIDASTGELIGSFDNVTYTKENLFQYDNISYRVNTEGIDSRTVKLRLNIDDNFSPGYSLSDKYSDETVLMKTNSREISFQGAMTVESYDLAQNYPNPFNPSTTIKYQIPEDGIVSLKIYDILGKEVKTLVNEQKPVGRYEVKFDATDLATGVYIYRLKVNDFVSVKKMVLMK